MQRLMQGASAPARGDARPDRTGPGPDDGRFTLVVDLDGHVVWSSEAVSVCYPGGQAGRGAAELMGGDWLRSDGTREALAAHGSWTSPAGTCGGCGGSVVAVLRQRIADGGVAGWHAEVRHATDARDATSLSVRGRLERLHAIAVRLIAAGTPEDVALVVCEEAAPAVGAFGATLAFADPSGQHLRVAGAIGYPESYVKAWPVLAVTDPLPLAYAVRHGEAVWMGSRQERDAFFPALAQAPIGSRSMCALPLSIDGPPFGAIGFSFDFEHPFTADDRRFLLTVAQQCALAIERSREALGPPQPDRQRATVIVEGRDVVSPAAVRRVVQQLGAGLPAERLDDALLCASELVTNALVHTSGPVRLRVSADATSMRIEVEDTSTQAPMVVREPRDVGGRGLLVVEALTNGWGTSPRAWGKTVWAEVRAG